MESIIALNCVVIVLAVIFGTAAGHRAEGEAGFGAWAGFCFGLGLSLLCWTIYVAAHFIAKYW